MTEHMNPLPPSATQPPPPLSPMNNMASQPPAKRPRLTTDFHNPTSTPLYGPPFATSPGMASYSLPPSPYQSFNGQQQIQPSPTADFSPSPALSRQITGTMGPPERPRAENKSTDINALSDSLFSTGIDLREEENYMSSTWRNFPNGQATSFNSSFGTSQGSSNTISPEASFAQWSQSTSAQQLAAASHPKGALSQEEIKQMEFERILEEKHTAAARQHAASKTKHLNDPFLLANSVRERMHSRTFESQVRLRHDGVQSADPRGPPSSEVLTSSRPTPNGALVAAKVVTLNEHSSLVDILSLISLAAQERIRGILEDTYEISRARQYGSGGAVPPEWSDVAKGPTKPEKITLRHQSITGTAWDGIPDTAVSPMTVVPAKRGNDESIRNARPPTPPPEPEADPEPSVRFPSRIPTLLRDLGSAELELERKRIEARKKRKADKEKKDKEQDGVPVVEETVESPAPGTPVSTGAATPTGEPKMTKKERDKQAKDKTSESILRQQSNQTAALALGGFGSGKKYSWLTGGGGRAASSGSLVTGAGQREQLAKRAIGGAKKEKAVTPTAPEEDPALAGKKSYQQVGLLEETPEMQLRDVVNTLERDIKEPRTLLRGYSRLTN